MREIQLTRGKFALVDDEDYEWLSINKWYYHSGTGYATRMTSRKEFRTVLYMHAAIAKPPIGLMCDHANGNKLDNRRNNIRVCLASENVTNRGIQKNNKSGYKGVSFSNQRGKFVAQIVKNGKHYFLGHFIFASDAKKAYDCKSKEIHGEFSHI